MKWVRRLFGARLPAGFAGELAAEEYLVAHAESAAGPLVATSWGLWVPGDGDFRRIGWHLISKAAWADGVLSVVEASEAGRAGEAQLISDRRPVRYRLEQPGKLPKVVQQRVNQSIRSRYHKDLPGGSAWFVQRKVPGVAAPILQVRAEPGTDPDIVADIAREAAAKIAHPQH